jgi:7-carboxy-7-deazaguanine synthase
MRVAEIFHSVQGEGLLTGVESVFVRTSGCNLRCWFCDTPYSSWAPSGREMSVDEVLEWVGRWSCRHVVLTGGEPMLCRDLVPLAARLRQLGRHVTIETAGTRYLPVQCDLMSISPKLAGSTPLRRGEPRLHPWHERARHAPDVVRRLAAEHDYQIKFVIDSAADCREVEQYLEEMPQLDRQRILLMPQGTDLGQLARRAAWLEPYCRQQRLRFCPRRHIEWFGAVPGT